MPPGEFSTRLIAGLRKGYFARAPKSRSPGLKDCSPENGKRSFDPSSPRSRAPIQPRQSRSRRPPSGGEAAKTVAREWANNDFEAAFEAVTTSLSGDELQTALPGLFSPNYSSIGADFTTRMKLLSTLEPTLQRQAFDSAGANWAMVDPEGIIGQLAGLTGDDRVALAEGILRGLSTAPASLVQTVAEALPRDQQIAKARSISRQLSATDPQRPRSSSSHSRPIRMAPTADWRSRTSPLNGSTMTPAPRRPSPRACPTERPRTPRALRSPRSFDISIWKAQPASLMAWRPRPLVDN